MYATVTRLLEQRFRDDGRGWLRCSLGFSLLCSSLMCLRGSRSSSGSPGVPVAVNLAVAEGRPATNDV